MGNPLDSIEQDTVVLARLDGAPVAAWRFQEAEDSFCHLYPFDAGESHAAIVYSAGPREVPGESIVFSGTHEEIRSSATGAALGALPSLVKVGETLVALEYWGAGRAEWLNDEGIQPLLTFRGGAAPSDVTFVGDHAIWQEEGGGGYRLAHGSIDEETSLYYEVVDGDVRGFATDGNDMAWIQAYDPGKDGQYARIELWTAPYVRDPAEIALRRVTELPYLAFGTVGGGNYSVGGFDAAGRPVREVALYALNDGRRRVFRFPAGIHSIPLRISDDELLMVVGAPEHRRVYLYRVALDSLPYE